MINLQKSVPEIYYNASRDFQFVARTLEVLVNYLKTNADIMKAFPLSDNFDVHLVTLLAYTLGFNSKHNYNANDLLNVCSSFATIIKNKGSITSIKLAVNALLNAQQIDKRAEVSFDRNDSHNLLIYLPIEVSDIVLLEDLFDYILPCGFTYSFIYANFTEEYEAVKLTTTQDVKTVQYSDSALGGVANEDVTRFNYDNPQQSLQQASTGVVVKPVE